MLEALLANPGEIVTRDELRMRLWPANIFVDFDNGLNNAASKLRTALGDSASVPDYIETVGRRGYRFIGSVAEGETPPVRSSPRLASSVWTSHDELRWRQLLLQRSNRPRSVIHIERRQSAREIDVCIVEGIQRPTSRQ